METDSLPLSVCALNTLSQHSWVTHHAAEQIALWRKGLLFDFTAHTIESSSLPVWAPPALKSKHRQEVHQLQPPLNKRSLPWCLAKECPRAHSIHLSSSLCSPWYHHRSPSPTAHSNPSYLLNSLPLNTISTLTLGYTVSHTQCFPEIHSSLFNMYGIQGGAWACRLPNSLLLSTG